MAVDLDCSTCPTDERVVLVERLSGTQRKLKCEHCGREWLRGEPARQTRPLPTLDEIKIRFPKPGDVDPGKLARSNALKAEFLQREPEPVSNVAPYWAKYQQVFSAEGLPGADPGDLKDFANSGIGANPGNMSVFNDAWNDMGAEAGAAQVREAVEYLLRGTSPVHLEHRLTALINGTTSFGMRGFKESLLTKVLCIVYPDRYRTILKYTGTAGKREIARALWGSRTPRPREGQLGHRTPHPVEQRLGACTSRRRFPAPTARCRLPLVGQGQGLEGTATPPAVPRPVDPPSGQPHP